jgi:hypothetical protein
VLPELNSRFFTEHKEVELLPNDLLIRNDAAYFANLLTN